MDALLCSRRIPARWRGLPASRPRTCRHGGLKLHAISRIAIGVIVVFKGARTLIAHPDGQVAVNTTGNPGMAKGGSGDLLTGMIAGLLAQYPDDATSAVEAAVFLHGLAADFAVKRADEHTLLATDSLRYFSQAFRFHSSTANGYVWLQGLPGEIVPAGNRGPARQQNEQGSPCGGRQRSPVHYPERRGHG